MRKYLGAFACFAGSVAVCAGVTQLLGWPGSLITVGLAVAYLGQTVLADEQDALDDEAQS
jgi:hypothetical protein